MVSYFLRWIMLSVLQSQVHEQSQRKVCSITAQTPSDVIVMSKDYVKILRSRLRELTFYIHWNEAIASLFKREFQKFFVWDF